MPYDVLKPAGSDSIGIGDDQIRSDKVFTRDTFLIEHEFNVVEASPVNSGKHKQGSARIFVNTSATQLTTASAVNTIYNPAQV